MTHKHAQIVQPYGGKHHVVIVVLPDADFACQRVEPGLMTELVYGLRLLADVSHERGAKAGCVHSVRLWR